MRIKSDQASDRQPDLHQFAPQIPAGSYGNAGRARSCGRHCPPRTTGRGGTLKAASSLKHPRTSSRFAGAGPSHGSRTAPRAALIQVKAGIAVAQYPARNQRCPSALGRSRTGDDDARRRVEDFVAAHPAVRGVVGMSVWPLREFVPHPGAPAHIDVAPAPRGARFRPPSWRKALLVAAIVAAIGGIAFWTWAHILRPVAVGCQHQHERAAASIRPRHHRCADTVECRLQGRRCIGGPRSGPW